MRYALYNLFQGSTLHPEGGYVDPTFRRLADNLRSIRERIVTYRRTYPGYLANDHILISLINGLGTPLSMDVQSYVDKTRDRSLYHASALGMTSPVSKGRVFTDGQFFGRYVQDVIIAVDDEFDVDYAAAHWQDLEPVRFVYHPLSDLSFTIPGLQPTSNEAGLSVILINVPMLALQYRQWRYWRQSVDAERNPQTTAQFLCSYTLPNMLASELDLALFNRMVLTYYGAEPAAMAKRHPFYIFDLSRETDHVLGNYLTYINRRGMSFDTLLSNFPSVFHADFHSVIELPDRSYLNPMRWAATLARIPLLAFLLNWDAQHPGTYNSAEVNIIRRELTELDSGNLLRSYLPRDRYEDVSSIIQRGIEPYLV